MSKQSGRPFADDFANVPTPRARVKPPGRQLK
jgi:hypothetical protein